MVQWLYCPQLYQSFAGNFVSQCWFIGKGLMLGPLTTSTSAPSGAGGSTMLSSITNFSGMLTFGASPNSLGSISTPVIALAAAVSGLTKINFGRLCTASSLKVSVEGSQGNGIGCRSLSHSYTRSAGAFEYSCSCRNHVSQRTVWASIVSTCFEPGAITRLTSGCTFFPLSIAATFIISMYEELVQLPIATWSTFILPISLTFATLSGLCGCAARGSSSSRLITISSSYSASSSG